MEEKKRERQRGRTLCSTAGERKRNDEREEEHRQGRREGGQEAGEYIGGREREYSVGDEAQPQIYERQPPRALLRFILFTLFSCSFFLYISPCRSLSSSSVPSPIPPFGTAVAAALRPCVPPSLVPSRLYLAPSVYLSLAVGGCAALTPFPHVGVTTEPTTIAFYPFTQYTSPGRMIGRSRENCHATDAFRETMTRIRTACACHDSPRIRDELTDAVPLVRPRAPRYQK